MQSKTIDAEGEVVNTTVGTNGITVQFSRKLGRENYGNEECGIFMQLDADPDADAVTLESQIKATIAFAKTLVYEQLGVETAVDENGVVRDSVQPQAAKAAGVRKAPSGGGAPKAAPSGEKPSKDDLFALLAENSGAFYDNRGKKASGEYSKRSPDFKHKDSGEGVWLDKAPEWVKLAVGE